MCERRRVDRQRRVTSATESAELLVQAYHLYIRRMDKQQKIFRKQQFHCIDCKWLVPAPFLIFDQVFSMLNGMSPVDLQFHYYYLHFLFEVHLYAASSNDLE